MQHTTSHTSQCPRGAIAITTTTGLATDGYFAGDTDTTPDHHFVVLPGLPRTTMGCQSATPTTSIDHLSPTGCERLLWSLLAPRWITLLRCHPVRVGRTGQGRLAAVFEPPRSDRPLAIALALPAAFGVAEIIDPRAVDINPPGLA